MPTYANIPITLRWMVGILGILSATDAFSAIESVACIPWQGDPLKYHTAVHGQPSRLKAVIRTSDTGTFWYRWVFGDGSESVPTPLSGARSYNVEVDHVYTGAVGTPFTARLLADSVDASMTHAVADPYLIKLEEPGLDARVNIAIDNGLWSLHKGRYFHGNLKSFNNLPVAAWRQTSYETAFASPTASAIHAFQINGHKRTGDETEDPYVANVREGFNWLFNGYWQDNRYPMLRSVNIGLQTAGDPDTDQNGIGIEARDFGNRPIYQGGMVIDAIIASGTPNEDCGRDFDNDGINETYREVVQDMCDLYAWGQADSGNDYGGWRYGWNSDADNSAAQWAAIGMLPAQDPTWNCIVPAWVKTANNAWLNRSHQSFPGGVQGGFGYTGSGSGDATTPGGMVQLAFVGAGRGDIRWDRCERWFAENWKDTDRDWLDREDIYGFYAFAKAMRVAIPVPITAFAFNGFDWYRGSAQIMGLAQKVSDRLIASHAWTTGPWVNETLATSWSVIILRPVLFQEAPIACFNAQPNPTYANTTVEFDPACSGHSDPAKNIANLVLFEWDWNHDGTFDAATTQPEILTQSFACPSVPCVFPVTLRVTDDIGNQATFRQDIRITDPPHPPVARLKGPYWISLCELDALRLDATDSFDPDAGNHEAGCTTCPDDAITAWDWDLNGAPWTYPGPAGAVVDLGPDWHQYFPIAGTFDIGIRVTDNSAAAYPGSRQPNLTHEAFSKVYLFEDGPCAVTLAGGCQKASLSWEATGADQYSVLVSGEGANTGFRTLTETTANSVELVDLPLGVKRWIRIAASFGNRTTLSPAILLLADPAACKPLADAGGPYEACAGDSLNLTAERSAAVLGSLVAWEWDLNDDGVFDDASGERVAHRWDQPGTYRIGVRVTSDGSTVLTSENHTTVRITPCQCLNDLAARPKVDKIQLTWTHEPDAQAYNVYRHDSPWFELTADRRIVTGLASTFATYLDANVPLGATFYYRVTKIVGGQEVCHSDEVHGTTIPRRANLPPLANAGPDQEVQTTQRVQLDGSRSFDPNNSPITFRWQLSSRPSGSQAALDDSTSPRPRFTADVKGIYSAELTVNDGTYTSAPDRVTIRTENAAPVADPGLHPFVPVGTIVELNGSKSSDPDGDPLSFRWFLASKPLKSDTSILDPTAEKTSLSIDAAGTYEVTLIVNDGLSDSEPAVLIITTINSAPVARAGADRTIAVFSTVLLEGSASTDPDGDPLSFEWTLAARPQGSSADLSSSTSTQTSLTPDRAGTYFIQLVAFDGTLRSQPDDVTVVANAGPIANAGPDRVTRTALAVELDGSASHDPENDALTYAWSLVSKPNGSQAALESSEIQKPSFTPDRKGEYRLELRVSDGLSVSSPDLVVVVVENSAPVANAGPDVEVNVGHLAALSGTTSSDPDSDALWYQWFLVSKPAGSDVSLSDTASPTPSFVADRPGEYRLELVVSDGEASSVPDTVVVRTRNRPPLAEAGPSQTRFAGDTFALDGSASEDPDGDDLQFAWSMVSSPPNSQPNLHPLDSPTPVLSTDLAGEYTVALSVHDGTVASVPDQVILIAKPFRLVPDIVGLAQGTAAQTVTDAGLTVGTVITQAHPSVPTGIVLEQSPVAGTKVDPGAPVALVVSSGVDSQNPTVAITATPTHVPAGGTVLITLLASDDGAIVGLTLTVNDVPVVLDQNQAFFVCPAIGPYLAKATATDSAGNVAEAQTTFFAVDPTDTTPPVVILTAPADNASVTLLSDVTGSAYDPDGKFAYYTVDLAPADQVDLNTLESPAFVEIARSSTPVQDGKLATFDPTLLQNDAYVIRLTGWDQNGQGDRKAVVVHVSGELKLGNFRLEFTDLTVPVAGIPIQISRVYDTLDANRKGDFGFGWRFGIRDPRIFETLRPSAVGPTMYPGCRVFINTPDGRRVGFTAFTRSNGGFLFPWIVEVAFRPDPGVYEHLESAGYNQGTLNALFLQGQYFDGLGDQPYDPAAYRLILKDGTTYDYSQSEGLQKVQDPTGNHLDFTSAGILHYPAGSQTPDQQVDFHRDAEGRITRIVDPDGHSLFYTYDSLGDLQSFADQESNLTRYAYHSRRSHYLESIFDPLGRQAIRTEYDDQGRVVAIIDALGNRTLQGFDTDQNVGTYTDANGHVSTQSYDAQGNITRTVDPIGAVTEYAFDNNNDEISRKDPRGLTTRREYDSRGNLTKITDALGHVTTMTHNDLGKPLTVTDALGNTTAFTYNPQGLLTQVVNALGQVIAIRRDPQGRVVSLTDPAGATTSYEYAAGCGCSNPSRILQPDGTSRTTDHNAFGQPTREINELGQVTAYTYDATGRLTKTTDPEGNATTYQYAGELRSLETDALGRTTRYAYNASDRLVSIEHPDGSRIQFEYDAVGNRTAVIDPLGQRTTFEYDPANRLIRQTDPEGNSTTFAHDPTGNRVRVTDRNGRRRTFDYDGASRMTREQWWGDSDVERTIQYTYDARGSLVQAIDPAAQVQFVFDALQRLTEDSQSNVPGLSDFHLNYTYDPAGNLASIVDNSGVEVRSSHGPRKELLMRSWHLGGAHGASVQFSYDAAGNRMSLSRFGDTPASIPVGSTLAQYNGVAAVTRILHSKNSGDVISDYQYARDAAQQLTQRSLNGSPTTFQYDSRGQLLRSTDTSLSIDESFTYDPAGNRSGNGQVIGPDNRLVEDAAHRYAYDREGQLISRVAKSDASSNVYTYDHRGRLVLAIDKSPAGDVLATTEFIYDALNRRIARVRNGVRQHFLIQGEHLWAEADANGTITRRFLHGPRTDEVIARFDTVRGVDWYLTDHLGTVRELVDATGDLANRVHYRAFGQIHSQANAALGDQFSFVGRERDPDLNLHYFRARWYDSDQGRFLSQDPLRFLEDPLAWNTESPGRLGHGWQLLGRALGVDFDVLGSKAPPDLDGLGKTVDIHPYRYAFNSPNRYTDPTGLVSLIEYQHLTVQQFISRYCLASVGRRIAGNLLEVTIAQLLTGSVPGVPNKEVKAALKILKQMRFRKPC